MLTPAKFYAVSGVVLASVILLYLYYHVDYTVRSDGRSHSDRSSPRRPTYNGHSVLGLSGLDYDYEVSNTSYPPPSIARGDLYFSEESPTTVPPPALTTRPRSTDSTTPKNYMFSLRLPEQLTMCTAHFHQFLNLVFLRSGIPTAQPKGFPKGW